MCTLRIITNASRGSQQPGVSCCYTTEWSNPRLIVAIPGQTTCHSNVHLIFNMWPLLYDRNATAAVIFWTRILCAHQKNANSVRGFKLLFWNRHEQQLAYLEMYLCILLFWPRFTNELRYKSCETAHTAFPNERYKQPKLKVCRDEVWETRSMHTNDNSATIKHKPHPTFAFPNARY